MLHVVLGPDMLFKIEERLKQNQYKEILQRNFINIIMEYDLNLSFLIFQKDNGGVHATKKSVPVV